MALVMSATAGESPSFQPLVVGPPRSGFSLLIAVLSQIYGFTPGKRQPWRSRVQAYAADSGARISTAIGRVFEAHGLGPELVYNGTFRDVAGGPKWLDPDYPGRACFRKYIGVRGMGDFTLVTAHPRELLDIHEVVHSHSDPARWASDPGYQAYMKFASVRHPAGIVNSSCFSINALTSEYLERFRPADTHNDGLRRNLALYKLTDLDFFQGLIKPLKAYLDEYLACREHYCEMKWEDLIGAPAPTIARLAGVAGVTVTPALAGDMWEVLRNRNLTGAHGHNFRRGHGRVGEWRGSLVNEHLELLRAGGMEEISVALGYGPFADLTEREYTDFQRKVSDYVRRGTVFRETGDDVLFGFAFNKSNLDASRYEFFRSYAWREHTRVERSCFADEALLFEVWDAAEKAAAEFNAGLAALLCSAKSSVAGPACAMDPPRLLQRIGKWSVVVYGGRFFGIPLRMGRVDLEKIDPEAEPGLLKADSHAELMAEIDRRRAWFGIPYMLGA